MKNNTLIKYLFITMHLIGFSAFAQNHTENISNAWPAINSYTKQHLKIMVLDERPYVISGKKDKSYLGAVRSAYGIPFDIVTESSKPLSEDIEKAVVNGYSNAGIEAAALETAARGALKSNSPTESLLVITINEWTSDTYGKSTGFTYKITGDTYNNAGKILATVTINGSPQTFSSPLNGGRHALTELLSNTDIVRSLMPASTSKPINSNKSEIIQIQNNDSSGIALSEKTRLLKIKELLESGAITRTEYDKKKSEIINSL